MATKTIVAPKTSAKSAQEGKKVVVSKDKKVVTTTTTTKKEEVLPLASGKVMSAPKGAPVQPKAEPVKKAEPKAKTAKTNEHKVDTRTITVVNKENPHHEGTGRAKAFDAMLKCKTAQAYLETGNKAKYLGRWAKSGHIKLS